MATLKEWLESPKKDHGIGLALLTKYSKNRTMLQSLSRKPNPEKLEYELRKIAKEQGIVIGTVEKTESHSDQVIDQMNADQKPDDLVKDKLDELESGASEIVSDKLGELESDAEDIVSDNVNDLKSTVQNIVEDKISEFESQVEEIMSGKLEVIRDGRKVKFEDLSPEMQARWTQNKDAYKEIRALHEKLKLMENATPEDRQPLTERICKLDDQIRDNWAEIDAYVPVPAGSATDAPVIDHKRIQSNRKYISTNLKKLSEQQDPVKAVKIVAELQVRYDELKAAGEYLLPITTSELNKAGVKC